MEDTRDISLYWNNGLKMNESEWEALHGEVVWAKCASYPYWPCYVCDLSNLPPTASEEVEDEGRKWFGSKHTVFFYGDGTYGFATPKLIEPYNVETKEKYSKQKIPKKDSPKFQKAMELADSEVMLPKDGRLSWLYVENSDADNDSAEVEEIPPKKKSKKLKKEPEDDAVSVDLDDVFNKKKSGKEDEEEEEPSSESSESITKKSKPTAPKKRKTVVADDDNGDGDDEAPRKIKKKRLLKSNIPDAQSKAVVKKSRALEAAKAEIQNETPAERLQRLKQILELTTSEKSFAEERALKVLEKLSLMPLTYDQLRDSGIVKVVTELRRLEKAPKIAEAAKKLREQWKNSVAQQAVPTPTAAPPAKAPSTVSASSALSVVKPERVRQASAESTGRAPSSPAKKNGIPDEVASNVFRLRSVHLLDESLCRIDNALQAEKHIHAQYQREPDKYMQCICKLHYLLQKSKPITQDMQELKTQFIDRIDLI